MTSEQIDLTHDTELIGENEQVHMHVFGTPLRVLDHGQGTHVWDVDGNEYLDFLAGIAVNSIGYAHPAWIEAVSAQAAQVAHVSNYFATRPQISLAAKLVELAGAPQGSHVYFAKLYGRSLGADKPYRIIALEHGFHGRTMGALSATWKPAIREPFQPLVPNFEFVPANDLDAMRAAFEATDSGPVASVIMELIQGEAGVLPLDPEFVRGVRSLCDEHHTKLIVDEVQTGMGRTGKWFAFQRDDLGGITPDMVTFAKGVAGGFPMGGMIAFGEELSNLFSPGTHGSTFAGNPLGAAAGLATIGVIEREDLLVNAEAGNSCGGRFAHAAIRCSNPCVAVGCSTRSCSHIPARMRQWIGHWSTGSSSMPWHLTPYVSHRRSW